MACFIVFEGGDGSGKSTQARSLLRRLRRRGIKVLHTREPGGTPLGQSLRLLLKSGEAMTPMSELMLFEAARAQLVQQVIRPFLDQGGVVIADRFTSSTMAYQGYGRGLDRELIERLNREATGGLEPDLTVLLDLPVETALARKGSGKGDNFDDAPVDFHRKIRRGYSALAASDPEGWLVLDGQRPPEELGREIWAKVQGIL
ncbi:MAG: dTMP kinase [Chloroflexi bacterium]|nr:dTMP kinase [Chloroflexota bacterium]MCI0829064.1 dTMP kinase [Chloroflexota bacterium]MCI0864883.1 dTMP kinase [Chloroflexota bacterium]MCI0898813.1 dTMP kinase [Chloroflexota bacterium]MCI0900191.1 dTMP kinase [Chloroflexota bacterium]